MAKIKTTDWILVGLAAVAVFDSLYVRHKSLAMAEKLAEQPGETALPVEGDAGSLAGYSQADRYLGRCAGIPRN